MWHKKIKITYVDGEEIHLTTREWGDVRAEGVNRVLFEGAVTRSGDSIYYLLPEKITHTEFAWVVGSFSVYQNTCQEHVMRMNGECFMRTRRTAPDLFHKQIKTGWWRIIEDDGDD